VGGADGSLAAGGPKSRIPTRRTPTRRRPYRIAKVGGAKQPRRQRVAGPHLPHAEVIPAPDGYRDLVRELQDSGCRRSVVCQPERALDRIAVGGDPLGPTSHLVTEDRQATAQAKPTGPTATTPRRDQSSSIAGPISITKRHPLVSLLAFFGGSIAAILSRKVLDAPLRYFAVALGSIALLATVFGLDAFENWGPQAEIGIGGIERWIAYPVLLWLVLLGGAFMAKGAHQTRQ
jgi:hypothetical protein